MGFFGKWDVLQCIALGIWVGFLKQPVLPGEAPPNFFLKNKNKKSQMNQK
jgi:hypothetical protein